MQDQVWEHVPFNFQMDWSRGSPAVEVDALRAEKRISAILRMQDCILLDSPDYAYFTWSEMWKMSFNELDGLLELTLSLFIHGVKG